MVKKKKILELKLLNSQDWDLREIQKAYYVPSKMYKGKLLRKDINNF